MARQGLDFEFNNTHIEGRKRLKLYNNNNAFPFNYLAGPRMRSMKTIINMQRGYYSFRFLTYSLTNFTMITITIFVCLYNGLQ